MSGKKKRKRSFFKPDERFATKALVAIAVTTVLFIAAQYISFWRTGQEQDELIEWYFRAVVIECGAMMMKRVAELIVERKKGKNKTGGSEAGSAVLEQEEAGENKEELTDGI